MISKKRSAREIFTRVAAYVRRYPWYGVGTMVCAVLTTLFSLAFPKLLHGMIDEFTAQRRLERVYWAAGWLLIACLLRDVFNFFRIQLNNKAQPHC